jgi:hypothetical protein
MSSNINHTHLILCVTYTIMNKCCHTLFSSVLLHYSIPMWIILTWVILNSIHAYAKPRIIIITLWSWRINLFQSLDRPNPMPTQFCSHVLNYSTWKYANWVVQAFLKPSLVPKCNRCYSRVIVVTLTQWCCSCTNWLLCNLLHMSYS